MTGVNYTEQIVNTAKEIAQQWLERQIVLTITLEKLVKQLEMEKLSAKNEVSK